MKITVAIPFLNSSKELDVLEARYADAEVMRVYLMDVDSFQGRPTQALWLDGAVDGFHHLLENTGKPEDKVTSAEWRAYSRKLKEQSVLANPSSLAKPDQRRVDSFVEDVLSQCLKHNPTWITVPQLPIVSDSSRNKMNLALARATNRWRSDQGFKGQLVFPLVFTHQSQLKGSTQWRPKLTSAAKTCEEAAATVVWAVDSSLTDSKGSRDTLHRRFKALVSFHEDLREYFSQHQVVGGPYWGMNLVLWARRLCDRPAVSLGGPYRYYISGGRTQRGTVRAAIGAIRRWVEAGPELGPWLASALQNLAPGEPVYTEMKRLSREFSRVPPKRLARSQVSAFYKAWLDSIEKVPADGRALALYQDLSSAFVLARRLPPLPSSEAPGRDPSVVAEQLMLNCL